jgi:uncharacterized protein (DUF1800 family)
MFTRWIAGFLIPAVLTAATPAAPRFDKKLSAEQRTLHALQRLTFGPTQADLDEIRRIGVSRWVDRQLHPESIPEDPALVERLKVYESLRLSSRELAVQYPPPQVLRNLVKNGRLQAIQDPVLRQRLERFAERFQNRDTKQTPKERREALDQVLSLSQLQTLKDGTPKEKLALLASLSREQRDKVLAILPGNQRNNLLYASDAGLRREALAAVAPTQAVYHDLAESKLLRAVYSRHQLDELLGDFWFNHFNVHFDKGFGRVLVTSYERDAIRPYVLGSFRDMLTATAKHPAMLFYLDNWTSVSPDALQRFRKRKGAGLNENYARELLELHTLGVDGGYTQKDVTEVARCFTGWSIDGIAEGAEFRFRPLLHDRGEKVVLGQKIPAGGGMEDGMAVLNILMKHPSTARHISTRLAQRFVADEPPPSLIQKMAKTFTETSGDLRAVMKTMLDAPEFWSEGAYGSKMKMPFELAAGALRATGAQVDSTIAVHELLKTLGEPLYRKIEPTGYSPMASEWTNTSALLARMNFGLDLAKNKVRGIRVDAARWQGKDAEAIAQALLQRKPEPATTAALRQTGSQDAAHLAGLILGGPEFQRR